MMIRLLVGAMALPAALLSFSHQGWGPTVETLMNSVVYAEETGFAQVPPTPWAEADPADSLYRAGREAINRGDFRRAAALFGEISAKYPRSEYAPDAPYWRAFALYKSGRDDDLREALKSLDTQRSRFPEAATIADAVRSAASATTLRRPHMARKLAGSRLIRVTVTSPMRTGPGSEGRSHAHDHHLSRCLHAGGLERGPADRRAKWRRWPTSWPKRTSLSPQNRKRPARGRRCSIPGHRSC
mgnify:CR=1 FL=1